MQRIMFIGQAPPRTDPGRPFGRSKLYHWFAQTGFTEDDIANNFRFGSIISFYPGSKNGSHLTPTPAQIVADREWLRDQLNLVQPSVVVPIGKLSIQECLRLDEVRLEEVIGQQFTADPYGLMGRSLAIVPLPHPSGASTWYYKPANWQKTEQALVLLRNLYQVLV